MQLPTVRRDIHNLVIPLDFSDLLDIELLVESLQSFVKRKVPIRIGIVPTLRTVGATDQAKVVYHLLDTYGLGGLLHYLEAVRQTLHTLSTTVGPYSQVLVIAWSESLYTEQSNLRIYGQESKAAQRQIYCSSPGHSRFRRVIG